MITLGLVVMRALKISGKVELQVQNVSEVIMAKYRFLTIEDADELWYYENGLYNRDGGILIAKELEAKYGYQLN